MTTDPNAADDPQTPETPREPPSESTPQPTSSEPPPEEPTSTPPTSPDASGGRPPRDASSAPRRRKVLIGSQRDPAAYRPKPQRDRIPIVGKVTVAKPKPPAVEAKEAPVSPVEAKQAPALSEPSEPVQTAVPPTAPSEPVAPSLAVDEATIPTELDSAATELFAAQTGPSFPPPNVRDKLSPELEAELEAALGGQSMEDLIADSESVTKQEVLQPETKLTGRIVTINREDAFVEIGGREQGIVALKHFAEPPEVGADLEVVVVRYNREDGLYELTLPNATADVADWSDLNEGMLVDTTITGHNSGGLECEVNKIRGFIPISQISLYRVEDLEPFIGQRLTCLVMEANPDRRNLVLSRRAVLEREREEARRKLLDSLAPGQIHQGVVRKLMDFGAFVDLGGVDGLLHVSQLAWARVNHPSDVLTEGQTIEVRINKFDRDSQRISLGYRELMESPWSNVAANYPTNTLAKGTVTKLMDFGAFVELEPGVEGLVHVSELSHKRVWRPSDVVKEGQEVEVMIQSVDAEAQRISLSMKEASAPPESEKTAKDDGPGEAAPLPKSLRKQMSNKPLKGGVGKGGGGEQFGLKW